MVVAMPSPNCAEVSLDGLECKKIVAFRGMLCAEHRKNLNRELEVAKMRNADNVAELVKRCAMQDEFYRRRSEYNRRGQRRCAELGCETSVRGIGALCGKCTNKLRKQAEDEKRSTGTVSEKLASALRKQSQIYQKHRKRSVTERCVENGCGVGVTHGGQLCIKHYNALEERCAAQQEAIDKLTSRFLAQQRIFQERNRKSRKNRTAHCSEDDCETAVSTPGMRCERHRASLQKEFEAAKAEHGMKDPKTQWLKKEVLKQKNLHIQCKKAMHKYYDARLKLAGKTRCRRSNR